MFHFDFFNESKCAWWHHTATFDCEAKWRKEYWLWEQPSEINKTLRQYVPEMEGSTWLRLSYYRVSSSLLLWFIRQMTRIMCVHIVSYLFCELCTAFEKMTFWVDSKHYMSSNIHVGTPRIAFIHLDINLLALLENDFLNESTALLSIKKIGLFPWRFLDRIFL